MIQPPEHLQGPSLNPLQLANTFPALGLRKVDTVFWMWSNKFQVEGESPFAPSPGRAPGRRAQGPAGVPCCQGTRRPPVQLPAHQDLSPRAAPQPGSPQPVPLPGGVPCRGRHWHLSLWDFLRFLSVRALLLREPFH